MKNIMHQLVNNFLKKIDWSLVTAEKYQAYFVYETINNLL